MLEHNCGAGEDYELAAGEAHRWLTGPASAIWLDAGIDRVHGGFFDQISSQDGRNAVDFKRLRVTCRQIFVFATLDRFAVPGAREAMRHGLDFLFGPLAHEDGGYRRSVTLDGKALDDERDLYDLAFVLFALAAAFERTGDSRLEEAANELLGFLHRRMAHGPGGFVEAIPYRLPHRQNPHMHLLEACLAWIPHSRSAAFREFAIALIALFTSRFWQAEDSCLLEYFNADWSPVSDPARRIFEPGHHMEWVWLLGEARKLGLSVPNFDDALAARARRDGFSPETGLPFGEVRGDGTVADEVCRIWTVTEWLRVCLACPNVDAGGWREPFGHLKVFLDTPIKGLWREKCNARTYVFDQGAVPASSLYHIVSGLLPMLAPQFLTPNVNQDTSLGSLTSNV